MLRISFIICVADITFYFINCVADTKLFSFQFTVFSLHILVHLKYSKERRLRHLHRANLTHTLLTSLLLLKKFTLT